MQLQALQTALLTDKPPLTEQWMATNQLTSVAAQWSNCSHSTPVLPPVTQEYNGWYRHQTGQSQHDIGLIGIPEFYPLQVMGNGRILQPTPYYDSGIYLISALQGYSSQQVLMHMVMNSIQEFNDTDREATTPWLDHVKAVARKKGFDPLEIGMSKLKSTTLCDVNAISKEGNSCISSSVNCSQSSTQMFPMHQTPSMHMPTLCKEKMKWLCNTLLGQKYFWNAFITLLNCVIFQEVAMTTFILFEDCIHHIFKDG